MTCRATVCGVTVNERSPLVFVAAVRKVGEIDRADIYICLCVLW